MQLANFKAPDDTPKNDPWPHLREAQLLATRDLPNTYLNVLIDLGDANNIHFPNKQAASARLTENVLEHTYGQNVQGSGPTLKDAKAVEGAMQLTFDNATGLNLKGDSARVFAIAGADKKFVWATPQVVANHITLRSDDVVAPVYARFGWSSNPRAVLYNAAGVPASPFRTNPNDEISATEIAAARNKANANSTDADIMFKGFNDAFLVDNSFYKSSITDDKPSNTWNGSLMMKNRRTGTDLTWNAWDEQTPHDDSLKSTKFASATAWLQYTPAVKPDAGQ